MRNNEGSRDLRHFGLYSGLYYQSINRPYKFDLKTVAIAYNILPVLKTGRTIYK